MKLQRMMRYLRGTPDLALVLRGHDDDIIKFIRWWIDGSHATHANMRGQTGGNGTSLEHKINARSTTGSEMVSVADMMSQALWTILFLEPQRYAPEKAIVYSDNRSDILL
jgi:hypothetical protein